MQEQKSREVRLAELKRNISNTGMYEFTAHTGSFCGSSCGTSSSKGRDGAGRLYSTMIYQRRVDAEIPNVREGADGFVILDKDYSVILEWNKTK